MHVQVQVQFRGLLLLLFGLLVIGFLLCALECSMDYLPAIDLFAKIVVHTSLRRLGVLYLWLASPSQVRAIEYSVSTKRIAP